MDNERHLKTEFRRALDEVLPPVPWLEAAVREDLRKRRPSRSRDRGLGSQRMSNALPRPVIQLVAGVLLVMLAIVAVTAALELRDRAPRSAPASMDPTAYRAMVSRDVFRADTAGDGTSCTTLQSTCPQPGRPVQTALQRWLDDLNRSVPPPKFAVIDGLMRLHLAANVADLNLVFAAHAAQDQAGFDDAGAAAQSQGAWLDAMARSIVYSHQATAAAYIESVRVAKPNLDSCAFCQSLGSSQVDCTGPQAALCKGDIYLARSAIQDLEAAVVLVAAPPSLAGQDARLQRDLAEADTSILAMAEAVLAGDQAGFAVDRLSFQRAWPAVVADLVAILGG